ncbi:MAG TPA: hypothetical protein PKE69_11905, partial [Pyrinomonadaceae bacterium]|nr:hypothetical protein [Pyrinomonadaceae bacterium]
FKVREVALLRSRLRHAKPWTHNILQMIRDLLDIKMNDGSRHFVDMPEVVFFDELADHVEQLDGAEITEFITDGVVEMWLDFEYRGHKFSVNNQLGDFWFFVENPDCPEEILLEIIDHFRQLLER